MKLTRVILATSISLGLVALAFTVHFGHMFFVHLRSDEQLRLWLKAHPQTKLLGGIGGFFNEDYWNRIHVWYLSFLIFTLLCAFTPISLTVLRLISGVRGKQEVGSKK